MNPSPNLNHSRSWLQLGLRYDRESDRIQLLLADKERWSLEIQLTRRITRRLLVALVNLLARSNPILRRAPAGVRLEVIVLEHLGALSGHSLTTQSRPPAQVSAPSDFVCARSVVATVINVRALPDSFSLRIGEADKPDAEIKLSRTDLHRLLAVLDRHAEKAEWNLQAETGWLGKTAHVMQPKHSDWTS